MNNHLPDFVRYTGKPSAILSPILYTVKGPSVFASTLFNDDPSGLEDREEAELELWLDLIKASFDREGKESNWAGYSHDFVEVSDLPELEVWDFDDKLHDDIVTYTIIVRPMT